MIFEASRHHALEFLQKSESRAWAPQVGRFHVGGGDIDVLLFDQDRGDPCGTAVAC